MSNDFKYRIEDKKLIIESCPNNKINSVLIGKLINRLFESVLIDEIYICEGIEEIGVCSFNALNNIVKVTLPNSLKIIKREAFSNCLNLKEISFPKKANNSIKIEEEAFKYCESLTNLYITSGVTSIGSSAFCYCNALENVYLPDGLVMLGDDAFSCCYNLKTVRLPSSLGIIRTFTFYNCEKLENINFPEGLKQIESMAFKKCCSLKNISLPSSLIEIGSEAFSECINIKNVYFNEGLEEIRGSAFSHCKSLEEISLPSSLKYIRERAFKACRGLKKVAMNDGVKKLGEETFIFCNQLEDITLSNNLEEISSSMFWDCFALKKIVLPDSVHTLNEDIFCRCYKLKEVVLSKNIKKIPTDSFESCYGLEKLVIPEGVDKIEENAFNNCGNLKEVYLPSTLKSFDPDAFEGCINLSYIYLKNKNDVIKLNLSNRRCGFVRNPDNLLFFHNFDDDLCGFYKDEEYVVFDENILLNNKKIAKIIKDNGYDRGMYIKLYYWSKKRFIPSNVVIENMPLKDIDNFYINNNGYEWSKLVKAFKNFYFEGAVCEENLASFFKLCYVLGVFSESASIRDRAVKFLNEKIVNVLDQYYIHSRFDGFDLNNGFDEEYAEFFIKYYNGIYFMRVIDEDEFGDEENIDLMAASYNNFKQVKKVYPNRTLHTNRDADLLLPEHVMNAVRLTEYYDVDEGNEDFALTVGKYGYTQEQFEELQNWYNKGKKINEMKLIIGEDKETNGITYKLLSKDDSMCAVLGNITNCCQVLGGMGQSCVEYGMTMPNSSFITFNYKNQVIGQAWVWYDEESKTICLDNIEVPHKYLEKINQNKTIQKSFIDCLLRIEKSFKEEMNKRGLKVDKVTIGEGYNDIRSILDNSFKLNSDTSKLSDYCGYSDASSQYEIIRVEKNNKR